MLPTYAILRITSPCVQQSHQHDSDCDKDERRDDGKKMMSENGRRGDGSGRSFHTRASAACISDLGFHL